MFSSCCVCTPFGVVWEVELDLLEAGGLTEIIPYCFSICNK